MPQRQHMHPQLMRPPGARHQPHAGRVALMPQDAPIGQGRAARGVAHHLPGAVFPVHDQGQVHRALARLQKPVHPRLIGLFRALLLELHRQIALRMGCQRKDDHPRCVTVQPMHQQSLRMHRLHPRDQAIGQLRPAPRHGQQPGRLVQHDDLVILMQDLQGIGRGGIGVFHPSQVAHRACGFKPRRAGQGATIAPAARHKG